MELKDIYKMTSKKTTLPKGYVYNLENRRLELDGVEATKCKDFIIRQGKSGGVLNEE